MKTDLEKAYENIREWGEKNKEMALENTRKWLESIKEKRNWRKK